MFWLHSRDEKSQNQFIGDFSNSTLKYLRHNSKQHSLVKTITKTQFLTACTSQFMCKSLNAFELWWYQRSMLNPLPLMCLSVKDGWNLGMILPNPFPHPKLFNFKTNLYTCLLAWMFVTKWDFGNTNLLKIQLGLHSCSIIRDNWSWRKTHPRDNFN